MPIDWLLVHHDDFALPFFPGGRHLLKNFRGRDVKGRIAGVPCVGAIEPSLLSAGMSPAPVADRRCDHQNDLKAEGSVATPMTLSTDPNGGIDTPVIKVNSRYPYMGVSGLPNLVCFVKFVVDCRWAGGIDTPL
jgi:hypothetical protein